MTLRAFQYKLNKYNLPFLGTCLVLSNTSCPSDKNENPDKSSENSEENINSTQASDDTIASIKDIKNLDDKINKNLEELELFKSANYLQKDAANSIFVDMLKGYVRTGEIGFEYNGTDAYLTTKDPSKKIQLVKNGSFVNTFKSQDLQLILNKASGAKGENAVLNFNENTTFNGKNVHKIVEDLVASAATEYGYTNDSGNDVKGKLKDIVNTLVAALLKKDSTEYAYNDGTPKEGTLTDAARALAKDEIKKRVGNLTDSIVGSDAILLNMNTKINLDNAQGATFTNPASTAGNIDLVKELVETKKQFEILKKNDMDRYFDGIYALRNPAEKAAAITNLSGLNYRGRIKSLHGLDISKNANLDEFYKERLKANDVVFFENADGIIANSVFVKILKNVNQNSTSAPGGIAACVHPIGLDGNFYGGLGGSILGGTP